MKRALDILRSLVFTPYFIAGSFLMSVFLLWTLPFPKKTCARLAGTIYLNWLLFSCRWVMGIRLEMRGLENLPRDTQFIIAAKHQSAFEALTIPFMTRLGLPAIVLKRELTWLPVWGLFPVRMGEIPVDRASGMQAMAQISKGAAAAVADGRNVAFFPQGTRVPVGKKVDYKSGVAKVYKDLGLPVVPVALNSGVFWGRNKFFKRAGTVVFEFLPPIPAGMPPLEMMKELERQIETHTDRLVEEARAGL